MGYDTVNNIASNIDYNVINRDIRPTDIRKNNRIDKKLEVKPLQKAYILLKPHK